MLFSKFYCEHAVKRQLGFQDSASVTFDDISMFNDTVFLIILFVFIFVFYIFFNLLFNFWYKVPGNTKEFHGNKENFNKEDINTLIQVNSLNKYTHHTLLEIIWTIYPSILLYFIGVASFLLVYSLEELVNHQLTIKVIGHQWYWSYEYLDEWGTNYTDIESLEDSNDILEFDSYMLSEDALVKGQLRLLEVDKPLVLPIATHIRVLVTSADVLHCWAVPSLGIKVDAVPGRLNQAALFIKRIGTFFGQCSEICGTNHGFMPINVKTTTLMNWNKWYLFQSNSWTEESFFIETDQKSKLITFFSQKHNELFNFFKNNIVIFKNNVGKENVKAFILNFKSLYKLEA